MTKAIGALPLVFLATGWSQTQVDLRTQSKTADLSAMATKTVQTGTVLPATCTLGQVFFKTDAVPGSNLYGCTALNVWSVMSGAGGSGILTVKTDGATVGARTAVNLASSLGINTTGVDDGTTINLTPQIQLGLLATRGGIQSGVDTYCVSASGSTTSYTCFQPSVLTAYANGMRFLWKPDINCLGGGAITLNVDNNGPKRVYQNDGVGNPVSAQCTAGSQVLLAYDAGLSGGAGGWRILSNSSPIPAVSRLLTHTFDGGGAALTAGRTAYLADIPFACTVTSWSLALDQGTAVVDVWRIADGTSVPQVSNAITGSAKPSLSSGQRVRSTTLTGWSPVISANSVVGFHLDSVTGATTVNIALGCTQ